jgi:hypothetical protein
MEMLDAEELEEGLWSLEFLRLVDLDIIAKCLKLVASLFTGEDIDGDGHCRGGVSRGGTDDIVVHSQPQESGVI